jgi:hypothetical protein
MRRFQQKEVNLNCKNMCPCQTDFKTKLSISIQKVIGKQALLKRIPKPMNHP